MTAWDTRFSIILVWSITSSGQTRMASMTIQNLSPNILQMEYAIQGPVVARAGEIEEELKKVIQFSKCTYIL